jgi:hypothetical protein
MSLFYFTDNTTTYYVVGNATSKNPVLQDMVHRIKLLELGLGCHLEVVHVPGTTMIGQGTDGLSRGVWISSLHQAISSRRLLPSLFAPVQYTPLLVSWLVNRHPCLRAETPEWHYIPWDTNWSVPDLLDRSTVWCPPPEMASQAISFLLNAYVEAPLTTSSLLLIPRILQRSWGRLSGCITELEVLHPATFPDSLPHAHLLPVCVLHLASHRRVLPTTNRLDSAPLPADPLHRWHRQQAELLRGL